MEKLNAQTRFTIEPGDRLLTSGGGWTVVNAWRVVTRYGKTAVYFTMRSPDGHTIYGDPSSNWYGTIIDRNERM